MAMMTTPLARCDVCSVNLNSYAQYDAHITGRAHLRKVFLSGNASTYAGNASMYPDNASTYANNASMYHDNASTYAGNASMYHDNASMYHDNTSMYHDNAPTYATGQDCASNQNWWPNNMAGSPAPGMTNFVSNETHMPYGYQAPDQLNQQCSSSNYSGSHERPHPKHGRRSGSKSAAAANLAESDRQSVVMGDHMGVVSIDYEAGRTGLYCEVCQVQLNSSDQCNIHYRGVRHIRKAKVVRMREIGDDGDKHGKLHGQFLCGCCNVVLNSDEQLEIHRSGSKHQRKLEQCKKRFETMDIFPAKKAKMDPARNVMPDSKAH